MVAKATKRVYGQTSPLPIMAVAEAYQRFTDARFTVETALFVGHGAASPIQQPGQQSAMPLYSLVISKLVEADTDPQVLADEVERLMRGGK